VSDLTFAWVVAGLTLVTIGTRSAFLLLGERVGLPERIRHGLRYAPACALAALVLPLLLLSDQLSDQSLAVSLSNPRLVAGVVAVIAMRATSNMLAAMSAGMAAFVLVRALI
jgi:branched-subunit amino acid transport protein